jgi:hypothetical protein
MAAGPLPLPQYRPIRVILLSATACMKLRTAASGVLAASLGLG